ncbi:MAG: hypothetical protein WA609_10200 [Terriglobales bacterium]
MSKSHSSQSRWFQVLACLALVAFLVCAQQAMAQSRHHFTVRVVSGPASHQGNGVQRFNELFQLASGFGALPPVDDGGYDAWPCFPNANANGADCSQIAPGGVVIGTPAYTWSYTACDANTATSTNCGQIFWFYEDDTNDNTDDLILSITVKQGSNFILATGNVDFGPNTFSPGSIIVISDDAAFGTLGETGKNNGYCAGSKKTCSDPFAGEATVIVTTKVGPSKISSRFNINLQ